MIDYINILLKKTICSCENPDFHVEFSFKEDLSGTTESDNFCNIVLTCDACNETIVQEFDDIPVYITKDLGE